MAQYKLLIKASAAKELKAIPNKKDRQRVVRRIQSLENNPRPRGSQKLSGRERYRIRQGQYRIVYSIEANELVVYVVKIGHRKDVDRAL
ncbi:MAG: type II toxin-antitoxin system RelE/ParE family toxin [Rubricoccaceae bacterium]|nr:type II toxin-antitoxin system RelE/ParE family toxin [Rubricoccaceae bacterium]